MGELKFIKESSHSGLKRLAMIWIFERRSVFTAEETIHCFKALFDYRVFQCCFLSLPFYFAAASLILQSSSGNHHVDKVKGDGANCSWAGG